MLYWLISLVLLDLFGSRSLLTLILSLATSMTRAGFPSYMVQPYVLVWSMYVVPLMVIAPVLLATVILVRAICKHSHLLYADAVWKLHAAGHVDKHYIDSRPAYRLRLPGRSRRAA